MLRRSTVALDSWRSHGITYLQSLAITANALQKCVKEAKSAKYSKHSAAEYHTQESDGQGGASKIETVPKNVAEIATFEHKPTQTNN